MRIIIEIDAPQERGTAVGTTPSATVATTVAEAAAVTPPPRPAPPEAEALDAGPAAPLAEQEGAEAATEDAAVPAAANAGPAPEHDEIISEPPDVRTGGEEVALSAGAAPEITE